ncbi:hypothetical protein SAMN04489867_2510 [Pedococcus dokdonensis]|uniref:Uncharacterized protein n=1 Tax=Pedococcus dokdonensis TaxID=443156 RepID=A0A1H0SUH6_9MICO|nr:hypothetical protein [Pedococcus dokdonensis]SDP45361.1 hypothetical protein SAMN04489867_2510 [Pedococcus dokdonensis]
MSIETQLREALSARADEVGGSVGDPYARVSGAIVTDRRRRRTAALAGVAAVAALAVAIPSLSGTAGRHTTTPARTTTQLVPGPSDPRWGSMATWPTRGSLASDTAFVTEAGDRLATGDQNNVLYAGEVGGRRVVVSWSLSVGTDSRTEQLHLGIAPSGAPAEELVTSVAEGAAASQDVVLARLGMRPDSPLLVLTTPATRSGEVSASARVNADGSATRTPWQRFDLTDGTGVIDLRNSPTFLTRVKVGEYDGQATGLVDGVGATTQPAICLDLCKDFDERFVAATTSGVAQQLGVSADQVSTTLVYSGPADAVVAGAAGVTDATDGTLRLVVADSRVGDALLRSALLVHSAKDGAETQELLTSVPLDTREGQPAPFVLKGLLPDAKQLRYQVFAPGAAQVQLVSDVPSIYPDSAKVTVTRDSAILTTQGPSDVESPYRVATYDASGALTGTWPLEPPSRNDPFDTQP